jgi:hypothetical protein
MYKYAHDQYNDSYKKQELVSESYVNIYLIELQSFM